MANDGPTSHDMSTTLQNGVFGPTPDALQQMQKQQAAYNQAYQEKLRANQEWMARQNRPVQRMRYVPSGRPVYGQGMGYQWVTDPGIPGPAPDAPQTSMPYPDLGVPHFAYGGTSWGGRALVGEDGPEVVDLPPGAQVYPNANTTEQTPYWQMGGGYDFSNHQASSPMTPMPPPPTYGPGYGALHAYQPQVTADRPGAYGPSSVYGPDRLADSLYGPTPNANPITPGAAVAPQPAPSNFNGPPVSYPSALGVPGNPAMYYFNQDQATWLENLAQGRATLTGMLQGIGPDGSLIGSPQLTFPAMRQLSELLGFTPGGVPTLAGRNSEIAERNQQLANAQFLGNSFGGTGQSYVPGQSNTLPSRDFNRLIDSTQDNPVAQAAWDGFVKYMQANIDANRFGIIMRGEMVGNPTKGEQALMAGVQRRKGSQAPMTLDASGGV